MCALELHPSDRHHGGMGGVGGAKVSGKISGDILVNAPDQASRVAGTIAGGRPGVVLAAP